MLLLLQLDWRRALGVHLWYGCQPTATGNHTAPLSSCFGHCRLMLEALHPTVPDALWHRPLPALASSVGSTGILYGGRGGRRRAAALASVC